MVKMNKKVMNINNKGLTLLEVLITLAILGIVVVSFITIFTNTNTTINYSGQKVNAISEVKSILDEIRSKISNDFNQGYIEIMVSEILERNFGSNYLIFQEDEKEFYRYDNKKIHCLIKNQNIEVKPAEGHGINIRTDLFKIKIINFYDNGNKNVELSAYIPNKEDEDGK